MKSKEKKSIGEKIYSEHEVKKSEAKKDYIEHDEEKKIKQKRDYTEHDEEDEIIIRKDRKKESKEKSKEKTRKEMKGVNEKDEMSFEKREPKGLKELKEEKKELKEEKKELKELKGLKEPKEEKKELKEVNGNRKERRRVRIEEIKKEKREKKEERKEEKKEEVYEQKEEKSDERKIEMKGNEKNEIKDEKKEERRKDRKEEKKEGKSKKSKDPNKIGEGTYGTVMLRDGLAVKKQKKFGFLIQEYSILRYLKNCSNVVNAVNLSMKSNELSMELYDTNFHQWVKKQRKAKTIQDNIFIALEQILYGLVQLQDRKLVHGDIKPDNILIRLNPMQFVLGDCGTVSLEGYAKTERSAKKYRSDSNKKSWTHDSYSFGIMLIQIFGGITLTPLINDDGIPYFDRKVIREIAEERILRDDILDLVLLLISDNDAKIPNARKILDSLGMQQPPNTFIPTEIKFQEIGSLKDKVLNEGKSHSIHRMQNGIYALSHFFRTKKIDKSYEDLYVAALILILSSLFNRKCTYKLENASKYCKRSKEHIYNCVTNLITNDEFLEIIYQPNN